MTTKYMDIKEFRERGYLHELNRQFLHPLGLALEIGIDEDNNHFIRGIQDWREDPEGCAYSDETLSPEKAEAINRVAAARFKERFNRLGFWVQPVGNEEYEEA